MPYDLTGRMWFVWKRDAAGRRFRDFTYDRDGLVQIDPIFQTDIDEDDEAAPPPVTLQ